MTMHLGWFSTGRDEGARNLLSTVMRKRDEGLLDIDINFVFCNWEVEEEPTHPDYAQRAKFFAMVRSYDIPLLTLSWKKLCASMKDAKKEEWRLCYGKRMRQLIYGNHFDLGVLAGYALMMDGDSCSRFDLMNLQPSLPGGPKGTRQEVINSIIAVRAEKHGATMNICTSKWEEGPAVTYCSFPLNTPQYRKKWLDFDEALGKRSVDLLSKDEVETTDLFKSIKLDSERREPPLVAYTIKMFADGNATVSHGKFTADGRQLAPYDLTVAVDSALDRGEI